MKSIPKSKGGSANTTSVSAWIAKYATKFSWTKKSK